MKARMVPEERGLLETLRSPELVWRFQHACGVKKIKEVERGPSWVALDSRLLPTPLPDTVKINTTPDIKKHLIQGEHRYHLRTRRQHNEVIIQDESASVCSSGYSSDAETEEASIIYYKITNQVFHLVMLLGSQLGAEAFYTLFFSFWFWNIDGAVGRRVMLVWMLVMYFGQGLKDIIRWPRPSMPPAVHLEARWALEYGMPSTHAMVGLVVPGSVIIFTMYRYTYPFYLWVAIAGVWCTLVCSSRIYLGMHSVADILAGLLISACFLPLFAPFADGVDNFLLTSKYAPLVTITLSILAVALYPGRHRWTSAWGDTTLIIGAYLGQQLGYWLNYQLGLLVAANVPPPYPILWPTWEQYGVTLLRLIIGGVVCLGTRAVFKPISYLTACHLLKVDMRELNSQPNSTNNKKKLIAELFYKFVTYVAIGFNVCWVAPVAFRVLGCERPSFYTEI